MGMIKEEGYRAQSLRGATGEGKQGGGDAKTHHQTGKQPEQWVALGRGPTGQGTDRQKAVWDDGNVCLDRCAHTGVRICQNSPSGRLTPCTSARKSTMKKKKS